MDNIIEIKGASLSDIKKVLLDWIELYSDSFKAKLNFHLYQYDTNHHYIITDSQLNDYQFFFLVNYIQFPSNVKYTVSVEGFTRVKNVSNIINGEELLVYISKSDVDYDTSSKRKSESYCLYGNR